jgi:DNA-binding transcriptional LysR family regulator
MICTVVDAGSLSRAAAQLGVSQPALTAQLQRIERQLGGQLFDRTREGVRPTELGDFVLTSARVVLADLARLVDGVSERVSPRRSGGPVKVAGESGPLVPLFATRLREVLDLPEVSTEVEFGNRAVCKLLADGLVDYAIVGGYRDLPLRVPENLRARLLVVEPSFVALPEGHVLGELDAVPLAVLADLDWAVGPPSEGGEQLALQRACAVAGFAPRIRHHAIEASTARELVRAGAVTLAHPASRQGDGVTIRPLAGSPILSHRMLAWSPEGQLAGHAEVAFRCAAEAYLSLVRRSETYQRWWEEHPETHADLDAALSAM